MKNKYYNIKDDSNIYFNFNVKIIEIRKNKDFLGETEYVHIYNFKSKYNYKITEITKKEWSNNE